MTKKTISFPAPLAEEINKRREVEKRTFSNAVVFALERSFFGPQTVRQFKRKGRKSSKVKGK